MCFGYKLEKEKQNLQKLHDEQMKNADELIKKQVERSEKNQRCSEITRIRIHARRRSDRIGSNPKHSPSRTRTINVMATCLEILPSISPSTDFKSTRDARRFYVETDRTCRKSPRRDRHSA